MKTAVHQYEDKLLELAYGELPAPEANAVESHVRTCARCAEALTEIRAVRSTMGQLPMEAPPQAGLESLFAYADQAARRNAAGPAPVATWWRRLMAPVMAAGALSLIGVVAYQTSREGEPLPSKAAIAEGVHRDELKTEKLNAAPVAPPAEPEPVQAAQPEQWAKEPAEEKQRAKKEEWGEEMLAKKAPAKTAFKEEPPASRKMTGASSGEELGGAIAKAKASDAKNKQAKDVDLDSFGDSEGRGAANADDAPAANEPVAQRAAPQPARAPAPAPAADKAEAKKAAESKSDFGVAQAPGNAGGATPRGLVQGEQARPSAPPPPPLEQQAMGGSDSRTQLGGGGMGLGLGSSSGSMASNSYGQVGSGAQQQAPQTQREVMGAKGGLYDRAERDEAAGSRRADAPAAAAKPTEMRASFDQQLKAARAAKANRDTEEEVRILKTVLDGRAQGSARLEALNGICRGLQGLGLVDEAQYYCQMLVREFPDSKVARDWMDSQSRIQRPAAKRSRSQQYDYEEAERPAPAAAPAADKPATSY